MRRNSDLFVTSIPAGVPTRGVDMRLDAFAVARDLAVVSKEVVLGQSGGGRLAAKG